MVTLTASRDSDTDARYCKVFEELGSRNVRVLAPWTRSGDSKLGTLERLEEANGALLSDGNPLRLSTTPGGTPAAELLRRRNAGEGLQVSGTSTGATIVSEHVIACGDVGPAPSSDRVPLAPGMGLPPWAIVDQHFRRRDRPGRLPAGLASVPRLRGIALDEETAAFVAPHQTLEVVGSGPITTLDPSEDWPSSMGSANRDEPVTVTGMHLHVLTHGATFDTQRRRARPAPVLEWNGAMKSSHAESTLAPTTSRACARSSSPSTWAV